MTVVPLLVLRGWNVAAGVVQPTVVEPVEALQGRYFDVIEPACRSQFRDDLNAHASGPMVEHDEVRP